MPIIDIITLISEAPGKISIHLFLSFDFLAICYICNGWIFWATYFGLSSKFFLCNVWGLIIKVTVPLRMKERLLRNFIWTGHPRLSQLVTITKQTSTRFRGWLLLSHLPTLYLYDKGKWGYLTTKDSEPLPDGMLI